MKFLRKLCDSDDDDAEEDEDEDARDTECNSTDSESSSSNSSNSTHHCGWDAVQDDTKEGEIVAVMGLLAGILTLVGTAFVLFSYAFLPELRNPRTLAQVQLTIANAIFSIRAMMNENLHVYVLAFPSRHARITIDPHCFFVSLTFGVVFSYDPDTCCPTPMCYTTAALLEFSSTAAIFWSFSITLQVVFRSCHGD